MFSFPVFCIRGLQDGVDSLGNFSSGLGPVSFILLCNSFTKTWGCLRSWQGLK